MASYLCAWEDLDTSVAKCLSVKEKPVCCVGLVPTSHHGLTSPSSSHRCVQCKHSGPPWTTLPGKPRPQPGIYPQSSWGSVDDLLSNVMSHRGGTEGSTSMMGGGCGRWLRVLLEHFLVQHDVGVFACRVENGISPWWESPRPLPTPPHQSTHTRGITVWCVSRTPDSTQECRLGGQVRCTCMVCSVYGIQTPTPTLLASLTS